MRIFNAQRCKKLYLQHRKLYGYNEWKDVTQKYDWEKIMSNIDMPICTNAICKWLKMQNISQTHVP